MMSVANPTTTKKTIATVTNTPGSLLRRRERRSRVRSAAGPVSGVEPAVVEDVVVSGGVVGVVGVFGIVGVVSAPRSRQTPAPSWRYR
jgi:hypothetical protein